MFLCIFQFSPVNYCQLLFTSGVLCNNLLWLFYCSLTEGRCDVYKWPWIFLLVWRSINIYAVRRYAELASCLSNEVVNFNSFSLIFFGMPNWFLLKYGKTVLIVYNWGYRWGLWLDHSVMHKFKLRYILIAKMYCIQTKQMLLRRVWSNKSIIINRNSFVFYGMN